MDSELILQNKATMEERKNRTRPSWNSRAREKTQLVSGQAVKAKWQGGIVCKAGKVSVLCPCAP
jgi:hypothetical protein